MGGRLADEACVYTYIIYTHMILLSYVFFETNLGSTTECAADEVSFEDAWGKKEAGGPDWFLCDDTNIWPPDGG